jgi:hypothetical protein
METPQQTLDRESNQIACRFPASEVGVSRVLNANVDGPFEGDGRSEFQWAWTSAGDRMLIVVPHGDTYFDTEVAAEYDFDQAKKNGTLENGIEGTWT